MATTSTKVNSLYEDIVADLIPYYDNFVLLPNPGLIVNSYNIAGGLGNTVKIPRTNTYGTANVSIADNASILDLAGTNSDFDPDHVSLAVSKRGTGTRVSEESLEDAGFESVRNAVITRLSRSLAQSTDIAGFRVMLTDGETALTDISDINVGDDGAGNVALTGTADLSVVFSPEAMGYAMKREPGVKMFNNVDKDDYEMVATVRNGFKQIRTDFIRAISASSSISEANTSQTASLDMVSRAVANLRSGNAPVDAGGFYIACVTAAHEFHLAKELNGVGGISSGAIGSVAQDLANQALLEGLIGQAVGCRFVRSNNLPTGIATA